MARSGKKIGIGILVIGALILVAVLYGINGKTDAQEKTSEADSPQAATQQQAVSVATIDIALQTIEETKTLPGRVSAFRQSQIRPQVEGIITKRLFEEGAQVEKGQQLYQIDDARYKAALASAEADLKSAQASIRSVKSRSERYRQLVEIQAVSQQEYDDIRAEYAQAEAAIAVAQAAVDVAKVNLGYTKVYAPISGDIGRSLVTEGSLVTANQTDPLAVITQLDPVYVDMQQSGTDGAKLKTRWAGQSNIPVELMIGDNNEITYPHKGELKFSEVTVDEGTGSITLRAVVPNPDDVWMPGLFVRSVVYLGENEGLLVPQRAAVRGTDGGLSVWTVEEGGIAKPRPIQVSNAYKDNWIVTEGLNEGDKVIVEGYQKVSDGAKVSPSPWKEKPVSGAAKETSALNEQPEETGLQEGAAE